MNVLRHAAFHEAGHAVAAHHSRFHRLSGNTRIYDGGGGVAPVNIDPEKMAAREAESILKRDFRLDIVRDWAGILFAGYCSTSIAERMGLVRPNLPSGAGHDLDLMNRALKAVRLSAERTEIFKKILDDLLREWWAVERVADFLCTQRTATAQQVREMVDLVYWEGGLA